VIKIKEINWAKIYDRPKRPHHELLTEAEAIIEHVKQNSKKRKHDRKRI